VTPRLRRCGNCHRPAFEAGRPCENCGSNICDERRSATMRAIKSSGTKPERLLERALRRAGARFKRQDRLRPGSPDVSFPRARLAVFVHGEFWHGRCAVPKTNPEFWAAKFERNCRRDRRDRRRLNRLGWRVRVLWAADVLKDPDAAAKRILKLLP
jgi:DNA mismatch endonuclease (patch repair protein)